MNRSSSSFESENDWTARLADILSARSDVIAGIGDDAAVVRPPGGDVDLVYTSDAVAESVHFEPGADLKRVGGKMIGRLFSDLAAMGAEPDHVLLNLVVSPSNTAKELEALYTGAEERAVMFGASIIGGDTMKGGALALHGFASGHVPRGKAVLRSGARAGDHVYVTGALGGSLSGKHLDFIPRVHEGVWLRKEGWASAMMDLSDGLAQDLPRLCRSSGVGAEVLADAVPAGEGITLRQALCDGEDYELLFTVADGRAEAFESAWASFTELACTRIGHITDVGGGIVLRSADGVRFEWPDGRFDHLAE